MSLCCWLWFLPRFSRKSEKNAPKSATEATILAAIKNGDGSAAVDIIEEISSKREVVTRISRSRRGMVLFVPITNLVGAGLWLKAFLSRFLD